MVREAIRRTTGERRGQATRTPAAAIARPLRSFSGDFTHMAFSWAISGDLAPVPLRSEYRTALTRRRSRCPSMVAHTATSPLNTPCGMIRCRAT
jgi:hypothetical protein